MIARAGTWPNHGDSHGHGSAVPQAASRATPSDAMLQMHRAMNRLRSTGDLDRDVFALMRPDHEGAGAMARLHLDVARMRH
jgi:uncharacterized protein (DUF305 family)